MNTVPTSDAGYIGQYCDGLRAGWPGSYSRQSNAVHVFITSSPFLWPTLHIQSVPFIVSAGAILEGGEAGPSLPSYAEREKNNKFRGP
jgi:hypothetical protein